MTNQFGEGVQPAAPELLTFFKALSDKTRLVMVGLLAKESLTGEQLASILGIKPATVSHHLARLAEASLVDVEGQRGHEKPYRLRFDVVRDAAQRLLSQETLKAATANVDVTAFDRKVIKDFTRRDGSLKHIPAQRKKLQAVLRHVAERFAPGRHYSEKQVNSILAEFHGDIASLRRHLISENLLSRDSEGKRYWRFEVGTEQR
jgi:predicted transcriptional regulator